MATFYVDPENGLDTLSGLAVIKKTGLSFTSGTNTVTVASPTGIVAGMKVFSVDLNNSGGLVTLGTTVSSVSGTTVTLSANFLSTTINGTLVFSAALKTLNAANTLMVAGDTLRVKKSADPINTGLTSTWTHGSNSLTLSSSPTMLVDDCDSAYTFAQEWTSTWTSTSWSTFHSDGYNSSWNTNIESVSGLTGGKRLRMQWYWGYGGGTLSSTVITNYAAQKAAMDGNHVVYYRTLLQTLDLSNYTRISAWMSVTNSYPSYFGTVKLRLCSDAYGQTPVATFTIPNKSTWLPTVLTNMVNGVETPIGSGINSISIAVEGISLPASRSTLGNNPQLAFYMDNMIACLPASNASAITHMSLIGKNKSSEHWYAIKSIQNEVVTLDNYNQTVTRGYTNPTGVSESYAVYRREAFGTGLFGSTTFSKSGNPEATTNYSFGWSDVDMSTRNGESFFMSEYGSEYLDMTGDFISVDRVGLYRMVGFLINTTATSWYQTIGMRGWYQTLTNSYIGDCKAGIGIQGNGNSISNLRVNSCSDASAYINAVNSDQGYGKLSVDSSSFDCSGGYGIYAIPLNAYYRRRGMDQIRITNSSIANNTSGGMYCGSYNRYSSLYFANCYLDTMTSSSPSIHALGGECRLVDCKVNTTTPVTWGGSYGSRLYCQNYNMVNNDHRVFYEVSTATAGKVVSYTGNDRRINTGVAWRMQPLNATTVNSKEPLRFRVAQVFVDANKTVTFKAYFRRDSLTSYGALTCRGGQIAGAVTDVTAVLPGPINTWTQLTVTISPTASGVVEFEALAWGGTTYNIDVDDITVEQA